MATITNNWVGYLTRSYEQVKASLLSRLVTSNPEVTDHSESNILVIVISMFAGVTEMLNYYIDNMAREAFISTARRFVSMVKLVKLLDYRIKAAYPSTVDLLFTPNTALTGPGIIYAGTIVKTSNNIQFLTVENLNLASGATSGIVGARQVTKLLAQLLGVTDGTANQAISLGTSYVDGSSDLQVDGVSYTRVNTLGLSGPTDKVYIVEIDVDGIAYVVFGDNTNGIIPTSGKNVTANYETTLATNVDAAAINTVTTTPTLPGVTSVTVTNLLASSGASPYEDMESIRIHAPLSIRTLDRAVTEQDYIDITKLAPGVGKAAIDFDCGKDIDIYICPVGGGIAQSPLLNSVQIFLDQRKMITTFPNVQAAGETSLIIGMDVTLKFRADAINGLADVKAALVEYGSFDKQNINRKTRLSDIIALVDNLEKVDFLEVTDLRMRPYARPREHITQLNWIRETLVTALTKSVWRLEYTGSNTFNVIKDLNYLGTATTGVTWTNADIEFTIQPDAYTLGENWDFIVYPADKNIDLDDFTINKVEETDLAINIIEQVTPSA